MITVLLGVPFCVTVTVASPLGVPGGTWTPIWYRPTAPGVRPAEVTVAFCPLKATVGEFVTAADGVGAATPLATGGFVAPMPTRYKRIVSPTCAGEAGETRLKSECSATYSSPGETSVVVSVSGSVKAAPLDTRIEYCRFGVSSVGIWMSTCPPLKE